jgi:hypothetical protein
MVDTLVLGIFSLTRLVRYYGLHWALDDLAEDRGLDAAACRTLVRRTEVGMARISTAHDHEALVHGTDTVKTLPRKGPAAGLAEPGRAS